MVYRFNPLAIGVGRGLASSILKSDTWFVINEHHFSHFSPHTKKTAKRPKSFKENVQSRDETS